MIIAKRFDNGTVAKADKWSQVQFFTAGKKLDTKGSRRLLKAPLRKLRSIRWLHNYDRASRFGQQHAPAVYKVQHSEECHDKAMRYGHIWLATVSQIRFDVASFYPQPHQFDNVSFRAAILPYAARQQVELPNLSH